MGGLSEPLFYLHSGNTGLRAPRNVKISVLGSMLQMGVSSEVLCSLFDGGICVSMGLTCSSSPASPGSCTSYNSVLGLPQGFRVPTWSFGDLHKFTFLSGLPNCGMGSREAADVSSGKSDSLVVRGLGP